MFEKMDKNVEKSKKPAIQILGGDADLEFDDSDDE
jgi:hypothetical protein